MKVSYLLHLYGFRSSYKFCYTTRNMCSTLLVRRIESIENSEYLECFHIKCDIIYSITNRKVWRS